MNEELMIYESEEFEDSEQIDVNTLVQIAEEVNELMGGYQPSVVTTGPMSVMENN